MDTMSTYDFIIKVLELLTPLGATLIAFFLGRISMKSSEKKSHELERFQEFYLPYVMNFKKGIIYKPLFRDREGDSADFEYLLYAKIHFADTNTQYLSLKFLDSLMQSDADNESHMWESKLLMDELTESVLEGYRQLCRKLKYPEPSLPSLEALNETYRQQSGIWEQ